VELVLQPGSRNRAFVIPGAGTYCPPHCKTKYTGAAWPVARRACLLLLVAGVCPSWLRGASCTASAIQIPKQVSTTTTTATQHQQHQHEEGGRALPGTDSGRAAQGRALGFKFLPRRGADNQNPGLHHPPTSRKSRAPCSLDHDHPHVSKPRAPLRRITSFY
jgi:hypothetical protein